MKILLSRFKTLLTRQKFKLLMSVVILTTSLNTTAFAQDLSISGKIVSKNGAPIPGATVLVKGTAIGTASDMDGNYKLTIPEALKDSTLLISSIGFGNREIKINSQTSIDITLKETSHALSEIVVVGYGTQKKSDLTGAVSSVTAEDIQKAPVLEVGQALQGRAAGVVVTQATGSPGSDVNIRVRGTGTVGNSNPLYIVDGQPVGELGIGFVNSNDIESMEILKDASACAIYGARAANGVVLVTTKRGKAGKPELKFDAYSGVQSVWKKMNLLNATQWAMLKNEARLGDGNDIDPKFENPASFGEGTDWQDAIFRVAKVSNYNLSLSGGSEKNTYYLGGNYFKQEGVVKGTDAERISLRVNGDQHVAKKLKVGQTLSLTRFKKDEITEGDEYISIINAALTMDPITPVYNADGTFGSSPYNNIKNPAALIALNNATWISNRLVGGLFAEYEFIDGLKFKSNVGLDLSFGNWTGFTPVYNIAPDFQNTVNKLSRYTEQRILSLWENTISYSKTFKNRHAVSALAGVSAQDSKVENMFATNGAIQSDDANLRYFDAASGIPTLNGTGYENALFSYLGRVNYSFDDKYLLTANIRIDGSSRFKEGNRYGTFPSVSVGWKINKEEFMKSISSISTLKLRVGWGQIGNQELAGVNSNYPYTNVLSPTQYYTFGNQQSFTAGSAPLSIGNDEIHWETVTQLNIGLDGGLFDERIQFTIDYYDKNTSGMLVQIPVPAYVGLQVPPFVNAGTVLNRGLELLASYRKDEGKFKYNASANISFLHNEVLSLGNGDPVTAGSFRGLGNVSVSDVGQPIASFYGLQTDGIFQNDADVKAGVQPLAKPGDIRYKDRNNDGKITPDDRTFIGSPIPTFTYGFNLGCSYKDFDLNIFFQGSEGNKIFNGNKYYLEGGVGYTNMSNSMFNRWAGEGTSTTVPRMSEKNSDNRLISDRYVEDGSYMRIKNLQLGYTLPKGILKYARIEKLRIYVAAQNLLTFTSYSGFDPEIGLSKKSSLDIGIDRGTYPQARTISIGANLTF